MKVCIFCSANNQIDPDFFQQTAELGRWLAQHGHDIVFGGVGQGLMQQVARAAKEAGGRTIGVVPRIICQQGRTSDSLDVEIACEDLTDRKQLMLDQSDLFIALPGGIGTLDEVFTVTAAATLGYHRKPLVLYNMKGFWNPLVTLLDDLARQGMIRGAWRDMIHVAASTDELAAILHHTDKA